MLPNGSPDPGPDGYGPIDAVVLWVDGNDPAFRARRGQAVERLKREDPELAARSDIRFAPGRYVQHDEIRYCIRSILNHAPWMRRIWLVTDDQFPTAFDRDTLDPRIAVVSHREIFRDMPDALPVFNSGAIDANLWKIDGLAERFVYFNDDFFLSKPVSPVNFFDGDKPVLRGKWIDIDPRAPGWLQRRIRSARLVGLAEERFFKEVHTPYCLSRAVIGRIAELHPGLLEQIGRRKFRSSDDHSLLSLHNHQALADGRASIDNTNRWLVFGDYPETASGQEIEESLRRIGSGRFFSTCFNNFGNWVEKMPDVYRFLEDGAGPRLAFER